MFVQPNVRVDGDMGGFGLATIEAALRGTPVVAADLEGLKDAVIHGRTGFLVPSGDLAGWIRQLTELLTEPTELLTSASIAKSAARSTARK